MAAILLTRDSVGPDVLALKRALAAELGPEAILYPGLLDEGPAFCADTEAALRRWQGGTGLVADGIAGPHTLNILGVHRPPRLRVALDLPLVRRLFPQTKPTNIVRYLPYVTDALEAEGLADAAMVFAALGTIRAETAGFVPIAEYPSRYNTRPGEAAFSAYEPGTPAGKRLGNTKAGDGFRFRGRGFVQLTGRYNYRHYGKALGVDLATQPDAANAPEIAAALLARFLADKAAKMREALAAGDLARARKLVNGGTHGLEDFSAVLQSAAALDWMKARGASSRAANRTASRPVRGTRKDPPDLRDRLYQPAPVVLPDEHPPRAEVARLIKSYRALVLDQGEGSSCTGYALACVINFALWGKAGWKGRPVRVSPRMLYDLARRHDEYAGEDDDGSSCRGALKGWFHNGVCRESDWPDGRRPVFGYADRAKAITLGVYYRIDVRCVTDLQAAILQAHAVYVSAFTHPGWLALLRESPARGAPTHDRLPVIPWDGTTSESDGHAFALVGFNARGFVVQNSWGARFGKGGFAILAYEDWLAHGMDAWVASLGVPRVNAGLLAGAYTAGRASGKASEKASEKARAAPGWWDEARARRHAVVIGADGRASRYVEGDELTRTLQVQACELPDRWFRARALAGEGGPDAKCHIEIHVDGGLDGEAEALMRARETGRRVEAEGRYPLFVAWRTGFAADLRAALAAAPDAGRGPWARMKELAHFGCTANRAGDHFATALQGLAGTWGEALELHLVAHGAGAIFLGHWLQLLAARGLQARIARIELVAPACTLQFANRYFGTHPQLVRRLWLTLRPDPLLDLVSRSLEPDRRTPLLGMAQALDTAYAGWDGSSTTAEALGRWRETAREANLAARTRIVRDPEGAYSTSLMR